MISKRGVLALLAVAGLAAACFAPPPSPPPPPLGFPCSASPGSPAAGNDPLRSGWYPDQPQLNPSAGGACAFGELWSAPVTGQVYAAPLVEPDVGPNGTLFVASETNDIYGLDAVSGQQLWTKNLGPPWNPADLDPNCQDLVPSVGVTSTPAIDSATNTAYLVSKTYANGASGPAAWKAHAIDLATGNEKPNFPVTIAGAADNDPTATFDPTLHLQRPGLLLMDGVVYAAFGGLCDDPPYRGWVMGISTQGTARAGGPITARWTAEALASPLAPPEIGKPGSGIWQAGGRLVSDKPGEILLASGNGIVPSTPAPGTTPPPQLAEAAIRLKVLPSGTLQPADFWMPCNAQDLSDRDADLGSGAPLVLPNSFGTSSVPHLLVVVGKDPPVYLVNRDDMGGFQQGSQGNCPDGSGHADDKVVGEASAPGSPGVWATPALWPGDGGLFYIASPTFAGFGLTGKLNAWRVVDAGGQPALGLAGQSSDNFGFGSSSGVVTSTGTSSGSALVWIVFFPDGSGVNAELRAYDANPSDGVLTLRGSWPIGQGSKFNTPTVHNGRIYVGARDGNVRAFGVTQAAAQSQQPAPRARVTGADAVPDREG